MFLLEKLIGLRNNLFIVFYLEKFHYLREEETEKKLVY